MPNSIPIGMVLENLLTTKEAAAAGVINIPITRTIPTTLRVTTTTIDNKISNR